MVATVALTVLSPLLAAIALAIRLESGGPIIFRQRRLGLERRPFTVLKFRTMHDGAEEAPHREYVHALIGHHRAPTGHHRAPTGRHRAPVDRPAEDGHCLYKLSRDRRVTRVGRVLRAWSLDELPQLVNVLRGEMALVGPRPVIPYEVERYPERYLRRFAVKPGLTGLWQVSGRNERTYEEMVSLDIEYAERASLLLDLRILARTLPVVLGRQGVA
jgi:lipopolysaccharide/colanic/teichoic acid biosynthesis glycosyltransferase